jgi:hypothetical protein
MQSDSGVHPVIHSSTLDEVRAHCVPKLIGAIALVLILWVAFSSPPAAAKAPPLATTVVTTTVYAAPDLLSEALGTIAADTQVELTGEAAPAYLAILFGDGVAWVPAQHLTLGVRPGIDTAVTLVETPLLEAPMRDAEVVATVPKDETVVLTGASVDGYDAASHESAGGWINERDIAR